jgi:alpha-tubulin suppressor-like RCC1 family protein
MWGRRLAGVILLALVGCASGDTSGLPTVPTLDERGADGFASVTAGRDHTCALTTNGRAYCWGSDVYGQLGHPPSASCDSAGTIPCSLVAEPVATDVRFQSLSAGATHTCGVALDGAAYCWGNDSTGALGTVGGPAPGPALVAGGHVFSQITAGYTHTCALATDGTAYCWGANSRGQLGTGDTVSRAIQAPVADNERFTQLSAGQERTCGRTQSGRVLCWGAIWLYRSGGLEYTRAQNVPSEVPGAPSLTGLTVGSFTTCGLVSKTAYCWEANAHGEMGNGTTDGSTTPVAVSGDLAFVQLSAGIIQTCGVATDGAAYCWGNDSFGQLGVSPGVLSARCAVQNLPCALTPVRVIGWRRFRSVSTGFGNHSCGVTVDTNIYCWGLAQSGQLGYGSRVGATSQPLRVVIALP